MKRIATNIAATVALLAVACMLAGCSALGVDLALAPSGAAPQLKAPQVTTPAVGVTNVLRVGVNTENAPFSTQGTGRIVGMDIDFAAAIADELGLSLEIMDVGTNPENALAAGTVDIVMNMDRADTAATCWLSQPYLPSAVGLFATSGKRVLPVEGTPQRIGAQTASMSAWEVQTQYGEQSLTSTPDLKTAFSELEAGALEYVAADAIIGTYVAHSTGGTAELAGLLQSPGGYCIGVALSNTELQRAITSAVNALGNSGKIAVIESKWLGEEIDLDLYPLSATAARAQHRMSGENLEGGVGGNAVDPSTGESPDLAAAPISGTGTGTDAVGQVLPVEPVETYVDTGVYYEEPVM